ncbi:hypothetical protein GCM10020331_022810 [Ectobacillus funiculus]
MTAAAYSVRWKHNTSAAKIQDESMYYEMQKKHTGELPIIGVNTYLNPNEASEENMNNMELARASYEEKKKHKSVICRHSKHGIKKANGSGSGSAEADCCLRRQYFSPS